MNANSKLAAGVLSGLLIGVTVAGVLHAEQTRVPVAYLIAEVERDPAKPADPAAAKEYAEQAPKSIVPFSGRYVVRGGETETLEGEPPKGYIVVIAFDSMEKARGWYHSPQYEALKPIRQGSTKSRLLLVQGVAP